MLDDDQRKAVTTVRYLAHSKTLKHRPCRSHAVNVTMPVPDIQRSDIAALHHDLRDTPYQANRTLGVLSKMFNLAELWDLRPDGSNPCRHVKRFREEKRERFL